MTKNEGENGVRREDKVRSGAAIIFHGRTDLRPDNLFVRCAAATTTNREFTSP